MKELPTYTPDFEEYIRMKAAGTDGFPYERHYGYDHSVAMSFEEHVRRQTTYTPASTPANVTEKVTSVTENVIEKMSHVIRHVGPDKGGHWEIIKE